MNRKDFGLWGLELAPPDFARALAALGVFQGSIESWPSTLSVEVIKKTLDWLRELIIQLSPPLLTASRSLIEFMLVSRSANRFSVKLDSKASRLRPKVPHE